MTTTPPGTTTPPRATPLAGLTITSVVIPAPSGASSGGGAAADQRAGAAGLLSANPLRLPLSPAATQLGAKLPTSTGTATATGGGRDPRPRHRGGTIAPPPSNPATVIARFISVIPTAVWIALAAAIGLAAMGGSAAVAFGRRASRSAGEVAAVTAAAKTDELTGVLNRRGFTESAERELERARRYGHPLALAYVDVRGLKAVNDSEGHLAGDRVLKEVAALISQSARTHDVVGRMGGDELVVLLAEQAVPGAEAMTRRISEHVPEYRAALALSTGWDVTIGTASFPDDGATLDALFAAADRRLYEQRGINLPER